MLKNSTQRNKKGNSYASTAFLFLAAVFFGFFIFKINFTKLIFGEIKTTQTVAEGVTKPYVQKSAITEISTGNQKEPSSQTSIIAPKRGDIYRYIDQNGTIVMVSDLEKVPSRYRSSMTVLSGSNNTQSTPINVNNNQIYVSATINYQGRTVKVQLLVDTGATGISISPSVARKLGIQEGQGKQVSTTLADGRKTFSYEVIAEQVTVGPKSKRNMNLQIMPRKGNEETGLLGMSFLGDFPHMIDTKSQVIKWM